MGRRGSFEDWPSPLVSCLPPLLLLLSPFFLLSLLLLSSSSSSILFHAPRPRLLLFNLLGSAVDSLRPSGLELLLFPLMCSGVTWEVSPSFPPNFHFSFRCFFVPSLIRPSLLPQLYDVKPATACWSEFVTIRFNATKLFQYKDILMHKNKHGKRKQKETWTEVRNGDVQ